MINLSETELAIKILLEEGKIIVCGIRGDEPVYVLASQATPIQKEFSKQFLKKTSN